MIRIEDLIKLFGKPEKFEPNVIIKGVSIDSRDDIEGKIFFAIKGSKIDAHTFLEDVFSKGAVAAFIEDPVFLNIENGKNLFLVENVVSALGKLGEFYLRKIEKEKRKIAITGSAGKTTTRHIITELLSYKGRVFSPKGNLNTEIGVPLSIFDIPEDAEFLVFEFGADRPGDIRYLSDLVRPDIGIITNIGPSHIERFGSLDEIANTKWALADAVEDKELFIYNADDPILEKRASCYKGRSLGFGANKNTKVRLIRRKTTVQGEVFDVFVNGDIKRYRINLYGLSSIYNVLSGISLMTYLFFDIDFIEEALLSIMPIPGRLSPIKIDNINVLIIDDTYNSNPLSLKNSLNVLSRFTDRRRIAVLGDMLELGGLSKIYHREMGKYIALSKGADVVLGIGRNTKFLIDGARDYGFNKAYFFEDSSSLLNFLTKNIQSGDTLLFKASRGIKMEKIMNTFMEKLND